MATYSTIISIVAFIIIIVVLGINAYYWYNLANELDNAPTNLTTTASSANISASTARGLYWTNLILLVIAIIWIFYLAFTWFSSTTTTKVVTPVAAPVTSPVKLENVETQQSYIPVSSQKRTFSTTQTTGVGQPIPVATENTTTVAPATVVTATPVTVASTTQMGTNATLVQRTPVNTVNLET